MVLYVHSFTLFIFILLILKNILQYKKNVKQLSRIRGEKIKRFNNY